MNFFGMIIARSPCA